MLRSLLYELETALLHLVQAEDRAVMFHYPPELVSKIKLLKRAVYKVRGEAEEAFREATNGANRGDGGQAAANRQSAVGVAASTRLTPG